MTKLGQKRQVSKKPIRKKGKTAWQKLRDKLDDLFSLYIRKKAGFICEYCGKGSGQMHCHHGVVGRRYMNTRYEEDNCACVCVGCHNFLGDFPRVNADFFRKRIGSDRYEQLEIIARSGNRVDLDEIEKDLKDKLKEVTK